MPRVDPLRPATPPAPPHQTRSPQPARADLPRFRDLMMRGPPRPADAETAPPGEGLQAPALWSVPAGPPRVGAASLVAGADLARCQRILVGAGPGGGEARIVIDRGPLAGTEVHLRAGPHGVEAAVLTATESSRQTLTSAMDAVAKRLKLRGHVLRTSFDQRGRSHEGRGR